MKKKVVVCCLVIILLLVANVTAFAIDESLSDMVYVNGGCFAMGSFEAQYAPVHEVCLDSFLIDKYEVTQKEYQDLMKDDHRSRFKGDNLPVSGVTWSQAKIYCKNKNKRLPTEAEWEYAAREEGKDMRWSGTNKRENLDEYAWFYNNSLRRSHPVGELKPNGIGIYDMSGNMWEWVYDYFGRRYYAKSPGNNPQGPDYGFEGHVIRGGGYNDNANTTTFRKPYGKEGMAETSDYIGFRCAQSVDPKNQ